MKKIFTHYALLLSATLFLASVACSKNNEVINEPQNEDKGITETLTLQAETKVTLSDAKELAWEDGDKIAVWTGTSESNGGFQTCLVDSDLITVTLDDASYHRFNYAVKYSGSTLPAFSSGTLSITLPDTYDYDDVSGTKNPVPFVAKSLYTEGTSLSFRAVGALARIAVPGIPATANKLVVTFDKDVTGSFAVSGPDTATPSIAASAATSKNVVTVNITPNTDYAGAVINIPVPTGSISVTKIEAKLDDAPIATVNSVVSGWNAARAHGKKATAAFTPSMASMVLAPGNLYTSSGTLAISPNCYDHIYLSEVTSYQTTYSASDRVLFNWNEIYFLMSSTGLTTMPSSSDATTAHSGSYESLTKSDFGDLYSWRVPSSNDWAEIIHGPLAASRPGAKLTYTVGSEAAKTKECAQMTRISLTDYTLEQSGKLGLLIFPDNIEITATFEGGKESSINTSGQSADALTITKSNLDDLIAAGCSFLPANGMFTSGGTAISNAAAAANYYSSTQDGETNAYRARIQNKSTVVTQSYAKGGLWCGVRLVRPVE